jgi:hypothetical protein
MREFYDVATKIRNLIPEDETALLASIDRIIGKSQYRAPEIARLNWDELGHFVNSELSDSIGDWKHQIVAEFMGTA